MTIEHAEQGVRGLRPCAAAAPQHQPPSQGSLRRIARCFHALVAQSGCLFLFAPAQVGGLKVSSPRARKHWFGRPSQTCLLPSTRAELRPHIGFNDDVPTIAFALRHGHVALAVIRQRSDGVESVAQAAAGGNAESTI